MKLAIALLSIGLSGLTMVARESPAQQPRPAPSRKPTYTITLDGRDACVTPSTRNRARADGGIIEVQTSPSSPNTVTVTMTGTPAADSYLGCTSTATQTFELVQELEVTCSDPSIQTVSLSLDSSLVGYVRSVRKAGAGVRLASVSVTRASRDVAPLELAHPPFLASGTQGRLCNQQLPTVQGPPMPLGRYTLVATFVLDTTASGVCNAHAVADFSPDTTLPAEWVRMRDPFQGVSKRAFGFTFSLSAAAPASATPVSGAIRNRSVSRKSESSPASSLTESRARKVSY
jgi:hypothetical protein